LRHQETRMASSLKGQGPYTIQKLNGWTDRSWAVVSLTTGAVAHSGAETLLALSADKAGEIADLLNTCPESATDVELDLLIRRAKALSRI
jgi:hypothetical protein